MQNQEKLKENTEEYTDKLLYSYEMDYTATEAEQFRKMNRPDPITSRTKTTAIVIFVVGVVIAILLKGMAIAFACAFISISWVGTPWLLDYMKGRRFYKNNRPFWNRHVKISIFEAHIEYDVLKHNLVQSNKVVDIPIGNNNKSEEVVSHRDFEYEDFYKILDDGSKLYLVAGASAVIIVDEEKVPRKIINALKHIKDDD